ncbi:helix-turn-helix domain-containing protein [Gammaproteobacteria bacterium]|nr:helix-turn-helix domain-containing protein [Gammaproteobacteria bacterium]
MAGNSIQVDDAFAKAQRRLHQAMPVKCILQTPGLNESAIAEQLQISVVEQVAAFTDSSNPHILPLIQAHLADLVSENLRLLRAEPLHKLTFVEEFARSAAEHYFPLESVLHAYRVSLKILLRYLTSVCAESSDQWGARQVSALSEFLLEFFDQVCAIATQHHIVQTRLLADVASDQRSELLSILLGGYDESDRRVSQILRDAGYLRQRLAFCVILVQSIDPAEMNNPGRARRLADYIDRLLVKIPGTRLVDLHRNKVTIVFSHLRRLSGWSAPQASLAQRVAQELMKVGTAARTGISNEVSSTSQVPVAYQQAALAFEQSNIGNRVAQFAEIPLQQLLQHFAGEDFTRVLPMWSKAFYDADERSRGQLSMTLKAFADEDMNVLQAAKRLRVHPNTVYARFNKIAAVTQRDPRKFRWLTELLIVVSSR